MRQGLKGAILPGLLPALAMPLQSALPCAGEGFEKKFMKIPSLKPAGYDLVILGKRELRGKDLPLHALIAGVHKYPLQWHLIVTVAQPGDPTEDPALPWPPDRRLVDTDPVRDLNFGTRLAVYSRSFTLREGEHPEPSAVSPSEIENP